MGLRNGESCDTGAGLVPSANLPVSDPGINHAGRHPSPAPSGPTYLSLYSQDTALSFTAFTRDSPRRDVCSG